MPLFYSPHAGFRLLVKPQYDRRHPTTGDIIETEHSIWAEFGKFGERTTFLNPETGETMEGARISGHYYDTDALAAAEGWDKEKHELVVRRLRDAIRREPYRLQEIEREAPKAALPWPTYDQADAAEVLKLAPALGLVAEALAYERENRARPAVLDGLSGPDTPPEEESDLEGVGDEPVAEKPVREAPGTRTITV